MKKHYQAKFTVIFLILNIFFVLSGFCLGLFMPKTVKAAPVKPAMESCSLSPEIYFNESVSTNHTQANVLPCCVSQNNDNSPVVLQQLELAKQLAIITITPIGSLPTYNFVSHNSYYLSPPAISQLNTIILRI